MLNTGTQGMKEGRAKCRAIKEDRRLDCLSARQGRDSTARASIEEIKLQVSSRPCPVAAPPVAPPKTRVVASTTTSVADSTAGMPVPVTDPEAGRFMARP